MFQNYYKFERGDYNSVNPCHDHPIFASYRSDNGMRCMYDAFHGDDGDSHFIWSIPYVCERCEMILEANAYKLKVIYVDIANPGSSKTKRRRCYRRPIKRRKVEEEEEEIGGWYFGM